MPPSQASEIRDIALESGTDNQEHTSADIAVKDKIDAKTTPTSAAMRFIAAAQEIQLPSISNQSWFHLRNDLFCNCVPHPLSFHSWLISCNCVMRKYCKPDLFCVSCPLGG